MAIKPLNSIAGYSIGEYPSTIIIDANGNVTTGNLTADANVDFTSASNVSLGPVGNVKITGGSSGYYLQTNGSGGLSWAAVPSGNGIANGTSNVSIPVASGNIVMYVNGAAIANVTSGGVNVAGTLNATGNANVGNLGTAQVLATANITAPQLISNISSGTAPLVVSSTTLVSNLNADLLDGYNTATANTASTVAVRDASGNVAANFFIGNGSQLTGIITSVSNVSNGTSNLDIPTASGNVNISSAGNANIVVVTGTGANIVGYVNATGNVLAGNVYANSGTIGALTLKGEGGNISNIQGANVSGAVSSATTAGTVTTAAQPNITSVGTLTGLTVGNVTANTVFGNGTIDASGNANVGNLGTAQILATANVTAPQLISNVATGTAPFVVTSTTQVANLNAATAGSAGTATTAGTVTTNAQPNITSVGTLTSLSVTGTATAGNLSTGGTLSVTGNANVGNLGTAQVLATANITAPQLISNIATGTAPLVVTSTTQVANLNAATAGLATFATTANAVAGANVSGQVANALVAGTVYTNAQPNITSVGTLTSLTVTGTASAGNLSTGGTLSVTGNANVGNLGTAGLITATGNVSGGNLTTGGIVNATGNVSGGNLTTGGIVNATGNIVSSANVVTDLIAGRTSSITITATGTDQNVNLVPTGIGTVNVGNFIISNVQTPVADYDAATKKYVDDVAQGLNIHDSCQAATPNTLAIVTGGTITYNNGASGVGANLTTTGSFNLIDGVNVQTAGTRILVKNEANAVLNGIYTWSNATVITRATDYNTVPEVEAGDFVFVTAGTLYDNTGWVQTDSPAAIGTAGNTITFTQFSGAGTYNAGTGLTLNGSTFSITNTTVTAGSYGNGDYNATFTVNGQGQLTAAANVALTPNAANLTGTTLNSAVVTSSLTSVGTLGSLAVTGNVTGGNIVTGGVVAATGNVTGANLITAGAVFAPAIVQNASFYDTRIELSSAAGIIQANAGGNVTQFLPGGSMRLPSSGASDIIGGTFDGSSLTLNNNDAILTQNRGGNVKVQVGSGGTIANTWTFAQNGSFTAPGNIATTANANVGNLNAGGQVVATGNVSGGNLSTGGILSVTGNATAGNISATNGNLTTANVSGNVVLGNASITTKISWGSTTTTSVTANQNIASFSVTGVTGVEFLVKAIDSAGSKYSVATVTAVTDGTSVDYSTFGTVNLGGYTGALAVNVTGSVLYLQVTPASSNSTVWTTQYRFI